MKLFRSHILLIAAGLLLTLASGLYAQQPDSQAGDKQKSAGTASTITGCLSKDASGSYVLTDENSGAKTTVTGVSDLEKHAANHKVTLTGMSKESGGQQVFEATKLRHVSDTCKAKSQ
ncbi:MAG TPA: hypothetical protein VKE70_04590 [Candidatus Solibacter sp.]|nr:hypothetical protein [Candidatus Solibacter sp.]